MTPPAVLGPVPHSTIGKGLPAPILDPQVLGAPTAACGGLGPSCPGGMGGRHRGACSSRLWLPLCLQPRLPGKWSRLPLLCWKLPPVREMSRSLGTSAILAAPGSRKGRGAKPQQPVPHGHSPGLWIGDRAGNTRKLGKAPFKVTSPPEHCSLTHLGQPGTPWPTLRQQMGG